jgi:acetylornithine deacetylase/succinyl-diaminopimelate desuccinylase-like protein
MRVLFHEGGMEAVTFGPGSITEAHAPDEFVEIDQLVSATHVLLGVTNRLLGGIS